MASMSELRKGAIDTQLPRKLMELPEVFRLLDGLETPQEEPLEQKKGAKSTHPERRKSQIVNFKDVVGRFLLRINDTRSKTTWAKIFYTRMCFAGDIYNSQKVGSLNELFTSYLLLSTGEINKMTRVAKDILVHLSTHRIDIDGAVIGHRPALQLRTVVVRQFLSAVKKNPQKFADIERFLQAQIDRITIINQQKKKSILKGREGVTEKPQQMLMDDLEDTSRENLLNLITGWSKIADPKEMARQVCAFAEFFRGVENVKEGELVLVLIRKAFLPGTKRNSTNEPSMESNRFSVIDSTHILLCKNLEYDIVYARVAEKDVEQKMVKVFFTPEEEVVDEIPFDLVFPIPQTIIEQMQNTSTAEKLVSVPLEGLIEEISDSVTQSTNTFLANQGVDINIIQKCEENNYNFFDMTVLKRTTLNLIRLTKEPPTEFYEQLNEVAHCQALRFRDSFHPSMAYMPTKNSLVQYIETFSFGGLAKERIDAYLAECQSALSKLRATKKEMLDGTEKSKLTQWWLHLIEGKTEKFLLELGYVVDALPDDYIEKPPKDIEVVKKNLEVVREVLDTKANKFFTKELIQQLCNVIYPVIEEFVRKGRFLLAEQFEKSETSANSKYENLLQSRMERTEQVDTWIAELMKDIKHLGKMKRMETAPPNKKSLDIVPISGLIIGRFVRLENELKTAIELWDRPSRKTVVEQASHSELQHFRQMASVPAGLKSNVTTPLARAGPGRNVTVGTSSVNTSSVCTSSSHPGPSSPLSVAMITPTSRSNSVGALSAPAAMSPIVASQSIPLSSVSAGHLSTPSSAAELTAKIQKVKSDTLPRLQQMEQTIATFKTELANSNSLGSLITLAKCLKDNKSQMQTLYDFLPTVPSLRAIQQTEDKLAMLRDTIESLIEYYVEVVTHTRNAFENQESLKEVVLMVKAIRAIDLKPAAPSL